MCFKYYYIAMCNKNDNSKNPRLVLYKRKIAKIVLLLILSQILIVIYKNLTQKSENRENNESLLRNEDTLFTGCAKLVIHTICSYYNH